MIFCPQAVQNGGASGASAGLVPLSTSVPNGARIKIQIDKFKSRATRLRSSIITGARLHDQEATAQGARGRWAMLTATYREGVDASPLHITGLVRNLRRYFGRIGGRSGGNHYSRIRYLWVLELTKRRRPHYHLLIWLPKGVRLPKPDDAGWWPHGMTRIEWARNAVGYLAKYASKFTASVAAHLPAGFRTHGIGGHNDESKRELRWWKSPKGAQQFFGASADIRKALGGYYDKLSGEFWLSPWKVLFYPDGRLFITREALA